MDTKEFIAHALSNQINVEILNRLPDLKLADAWLVSGALFQTAWNSLSGRPAAYGIKDYDIIYFDNRDVSWQAEDRAIGHARDIFKDLDVSIELRNQARVPLWYPQKFGRPYPELRNAVESLNRYPATVSQVALQFSASNSPLLIAPGGLDDIQMFHVKRNLCANFCEAAFTRKATRWKELWPEVTIEEIP